jgi:16S rRNA (cytidine1402-2'-O)-methyltransferase
MVSWADENDPRGEFCLIIEGTDEVPQEENLWWANISIEDHVNHYIESGQMNSKEAIKQAAKDRGMNKREVYQAFHID